MAERGRESWAAAGLNCRGRRMQNQQDATRHPSNAAPLVLDQLIDETGRNGVLKRRVGDDMYK